MLKFFTALLTCICCVLTSDAGTNPSRQYQPVMPYVQDEPHIPNMEGTWLATHYEGAISPHNCYVQMMIFQRGRDLSIYDATTGALLGSGYITIENDVLLCLTEIDYYIFIKDCRKAALCADGRMEVYSGSTEDGNGKVCLHPQMLSVAAYTRMWMFRGAPAPSVDRED